MFSESQNNEPVDAVPNEPESTTVIPPKRVAGLFVFNVIMFEPTWTMDAVVYVKDDVPITFRLPVTINEPVMAALPLNPLLPFTFNR